MPDAPAMQRPRRALGRRAVLAQLWALQATIASSGRTITAPSARRQPLSAAWARGTATMEARAAATPMVTA